MALPARPEKSTSGSATRAGGMSNLTHKQEEGARETARGHEVRNAQVQRRAARASSGHVATM
eukprot:6075289-Prymnesium_polylepis.1